VEEEKRDRRQEERAGQCPLLVKIDLQKILTVKLLSYQRTPSDFNESISVDCDKNQPLIVTLLLVLSKMWSLLTN